MTSIIDPLPTPNEIRKDPERVALHGLAYAIEMTLRALNAIHPGLHQRAERPYWLAGLSSVDIAAERIAGVAIELEEQIHGYLTALDLARDAERRDPLEDDLPF